MLITAGQHPYIQLNWKKQTLSFCFEYNFLFNVRSLGVVLYELCNLEHAFQGQVSQSACDRLVVYDIWGIH